jgi:proline-rich protein PRCC
MLLANYASDSGSDSESEGPAVPAASASASTSKAPLLAKKKRPVKITLDLPKASASNDSNVVTDSGDDGGEVDEGLSRSKGTGKGDERDAKRARLGGEASGGGGIKGGKGS